MKTGLRGWLQGMKRQQSQGFTLLELTIVLVVSGILAAIALPSFLNQASKAKQVEAKIYLGTLNRAQQSYMLEHAQFATDQQQLGIALNQSLNYRYNVHADANKLYAVHDAESLSVSLRPYVGVVGMIQSMTGEAVVATALCEAEVPQAGTTVPPLVSNTAIACAAGTESVGK